VAFHLTPGHVLELAPLMTALIADKAYDGDNLRADIASRDAIPVIPNKANRKNLHPFDPQARIREPRLTDQNP
jgi:transposase